MMIHWKRIKISKNEMKEMTSRSDLKGFIQVITQLILTLFLGVLSYNAFLTQELYISIPIFLIYATVFSFTGYTAAIHELSHNTVFKTKWLNEFFIKIFAFISWSDYQFYKISHAQHHAFTTHSGRDEEIVLPIKITPLYIVKKFTVDFTRLYSKDEGKSIIAMIRRAFGFIKHGREKNLIANRITIKRKIVNWNRTVIIGHVLFATIFLTSGYPIMLLLFTFVTMFGQGLRTILSMTQHICLESNVDDFRRNSRSMSLNPILGFLYWQMQYHIEHHMYAGIPFYNLKKFSKLVEEQMPVRKGLISTWHSILKTRKIQQENPDYYEIIKMNKIV